MTKPNELTKEQLIDLFEHKSKAGYWKGAFSEKIKLALAQAFEACYPEDLIFICDIDYYPDMVSDEVLITTNFIGVEKTFVFELTWGCEWNNYEDLVTVKKLKIVRDYEVDYNFGFKEFKGVQ